MKCFGSCALVVLFFMSSYGLLYQQYRVVNLWDRLQERAASPLVTFVSDTRPRNALSRERSHLCFGSLSLFLPARASKERKRESAGHSPLRLSTRLALPFPPHFIHSLHFHFGARSPSFTFSPALSLLHLLLARCLELYRLPRS